MGKTAASPTPRSSGKLDDNLWKKETLWYVAAVSFRFLKIDFESLHSTVIVK